MPSYIIFGGSGYIGTKLAEELIQIGCTVYIADIRESSLKPESSIIFRMTDVRKPISANIISHPVEWIFNFAAIHREPGHNDIEYFETNINGAKNVCEFAEKIGCSNIFFTSSISVYGPTLYPTDEMKLTMPNTPYGISKLSAEYIHKQWAENQKDRHLVIVRPGVIYGPGDPGNILRMIKAVKRGYFFLPVRPSIKKSYGYIFGLLQSMQFAMSLPDKIFTYNYVERETETLGDMIRIMNETLGFNAKIYRFPLQVLLLAARIIHLINPRLNGIHPERVKKVARSTHILPQVLVQKGFNFVFDLRQSLVHWKGIKPDDF